MQVGSLIREWSTESVEAQRRQAYWVDSICDAFLEMKSQPVKRIPFFGSIRQAALENLALNEVHCSSQIVHRDGQAIAKSSANYFYLITQLGEPWGVRHAGQDNVLQPGDSVLIDSRQPYEFIFPSDIHHLSIQLPIDWVHRWLARPADVIGRPIDGAHGWGAALLAYKKALTPEFAVDPGFAPGVLTDQLGTLMALACEGAPAPQPALSGAYRRCLSVMRERVSDPNLVAQDVAVQSALSLRSLHRAFAAQGRSFASVLRDLRLSEAKRMLASRRFDNVTLVEISQRCGFSDSSHFARQFRQAVGLRPSEFRESAGR
jgi:AraC family transcriptional regulator, positive regulator of tynA and feaB